MESVETEQIETRDISPAVENTMKQMLRQMDVLTNTVSLHYITQYKQAYTS